MTHVKIEPYDEFGRDTSWITQEVVEGYIYAWIKGENFAQVFLTKHARGDLVRVNTFRESLLNDPDYDDLKAQIWDELEMPTLGSIEYHIWEIERKLRVPGHNPKDYASLYKILGEYQGWITKPGEGKTTNVSVTVGTKSEIANMNAQDAELVYASMIAN